MQGEDDIINRITRQVVKETVHETLNSLGFDVAHPQEMQANLAYLDRLRRGSEYVSARVKTALITTTIPAFLYLGWEALKRAIRTP